MTDQGEIFDVPSPSEEAAPDRTIVGVRPPGAERRLQGLPTGVQKLLLAAAMDESFRRSFLSDPLAAARSAGLALRSTEAAILSAVPRKQLRTMIENMHVANPGRREFLTKAAAAALAAVAASVLPLEGVQADQGTRAGQADSTRGRPEAPEIHWLTSLEEAMGESAETHRPVLAYFNHDSVYRPDGKPRKPGSKAEPLVPVGSWFEDEPVRSRVAETNFICVLVRDPADLKWTAKQGKERQKAVKYYHDIVTSWKMVRFPTILFILPDDTEPLILTRPRQEAELLQTMAAAAALFAPIPRQDMSWGAIRKLYQ